MANNVAQSGWQGTLHARSFAPLKNGSAQDDAGGEGPEADALRRGFPAR